MDKTRKDAIARVTHLGRSRYGNYPIVDRILLDDHLWLLVQRPGGKHEVVLERLTREGEHWSAQLLPGLPVQGAAIRKWLNKAVLASSQALSWAAYASQVAKTHERLRAFRRSLCEGVVLRVNGYAFELVRRLRDTPDYGWIVRRSGTEMRLVGRELDNAVKIACQRN